MGEAKFRKECVAQGLPDPGPGAPNNRSYRGMGSVPVPTSESDDPNVRAQLRKEFRKKIEVAENTRQLERFGRAGGFFHHEEPR